MSRYEKKMEDNWRFGSKGYPRCAATQFCLCRTQAGDVDVRCCTCSWTCCTQEGKTSPCLLAPRDHGGQFGHELCEAPLSAGDTLLYVDTGTQTCTWNCMDTERESPDGSLSGNEPRVSMITHGAPSLVTHNVAPTLAAPVCNQVNQEQILTACSRAPVFEYAAPALATEYTAAAPSVTSDAHSQQLPSVFTATTVTTDVNLDTIGLVCPQISSIAVEPFFATGRWFSSSF